MRAGGVGEWLLRLAILAHPRRFREAYAAEMLTYYRASHEEAVAERGWRGGVATAWRAVMSALRVGVRQRFGGGEPHPSSPQSDPPRERWLEGAGQDVRYALRSIRKNPGFALVVVSTLALGLGANTAVFSVVNATLLEPLPYAAPEQLVRLYWWESEGEPNYLPGAGLLDYREKLTSVEALGAVYTYAETGADLTGGDRPERIRTLYVGADYFRVLGVPPIRGRVFDRSAEREGVHVAVVSHELWQRRLGGGSVVGGSLMLDGVAHEILGVMPAGFSDPLEAGVDVWLPQILEMGGESSRNSWYNHYLSAIGRLRPGVTIEEAQAEVDLLAARQAVHFPEDEEKPAARLVPLHDDVAGDGRTLLLVLTGAVLLLLLIACVNIASLLLARGASRQTELAVRTALGSSRRRLASQLLTESIVLSLLGGAAGLVVSVVVTRALELVAPAVLVRNVPDVDVRVFAYAFLLSVGAGVLAGLTPVLQFTRPSLASVLREGGRSGEGGRRQLAVRNALVVSEVALALVLVVGAGILLRSFQRLTHLDLGMRSENVWTFQVNLPSTAYDAADRARFHRALHERIAAIGGVRAAGAISRLPVTGEYHSWGSRRPDVDGVRPPMLGVNQRVIEGDYFAASGIPLLRGRTFSAEDHAGAPRRIVINDALARAAFGPGEDPVGDILLIIGDTLEIIGVVGDVPISARGDVVPVAYHSHTQYADNRNWALTQVVALEGGRADIIAVLRDALASIDPNLVLHDPQRLDDVVGRGVAQERFALLLVGAFAGLALTLAAIGLYGLLSYSVARRRREIGVRMALGARPAGVRRLVVAQGARLALAGLAIGVAVALIATRALEALVFGVSVRDPLVFTVAAGVLAGVALLASWIPSLGATRVHPADAFRRE